MSGEAINQDERVPKNTPMVITRAKLKIEDPPKTTNAMRTSNVVPEVIVVRLKVELRAQLTMSAILRPLGTLISSRIRSKMMIVSLSE